MQRKRCDINGIKLKAQRNVSFGRRNEENEDSFNVLQSNPSRLVMNDMKMQYFGSKIVFCCFIWLTITQQTSKARSER